ncbi:unnamed protein product, partial [Ectocarpus sp. 12 AP-2014]
MILLMTSATLLAASAGGMAFTYWQLLDSRRGVRVVNAHRMAAN